jgi:hypothetical protein
LKTAKKRRNHHNQNSFVRLNKLMVKIFMLRVTEIWAKIESNTGTKTVAIIYMKLVAGFG